VPIASKQNGFAGLDTELLVNTPLHVRVMQQLADWQKTKTFDYGGRRGDANPKFATGECGMFLASSASYAGFVKAAAGKFEFGMGMMPYWPDVKDAPQNSIIGGASLWVLAGHKPAEYKAVAKFFSYISLPEVQAASHQRTGYLPITLAAYELTKKQGYYEKNPGTDVAIRQINNKPPTANSKGLRLGNYVQVRDVMDEEMEAVWGGKKSPKDALDTIVKRGNELLRQFERTNK
jgi:sn-glycerol 3-phosphate transport system substrate-binding protein